MRTDGGGGKLETVSQGERGTWACRERGGGRGRKGRETRGGDGSKGERGSRLG